MATKEELEELVGMLQASQDELRKKNDLEASRTVGDAALYIKRFIKGEDPDLDTAERVLEAFVKDVAPKQVALARLLGSRSFDEMSSVPDPVLAPTEAMVAYTQTLVTKIGEGLSRTAPRSERTEAPDS